MGEDIEYWMSIYEKNLSQKLEENWQLWYDEYVKETCIQ